jgi:chromosome segregation ATPase
MIELMDSWSQSVHWSSLETSHKKEFDRLSEEFMAVKSHLQISLCKEADLQNNLNQLQDKEAYLQNNLNQLQDVLIPALKSELELMQMELEAKGAETASTKMQVSMLQDTIAELRGFLNDPDLKDDLNSNNTTMVETLQKEMEMERKSVLRLQLEAQHKDAEISQLSSQIAAMEHIVARSQKSIENLESQLSSDIQVHPLSGNEFCTMHAKTADYASM